MTKKQKNLRSRILGALVLYISLAALDRLLLPPNAPALLRLALYLPPYFLVGWDVLRKAWHNLRHAQAFDESLLMAVATIAAFAIGEYPEATAVMVFYQLGELFQSLA
ncbi:MAG: heavy metal translocating P-type ATPase, partial [Oscillospiraceae bacterium]|nr:heavy metal translocating P-type ATPase [Oscillospiraceae bacterium]